MGVLLAGIVSVFNSLISLFLIVLFVHGILRMLKADPHTPVMRALSIVCNPAEDWMSRKFPKLIIRSQGSYVNLAPTVLMIALGCLKIFLDHLHQYLMYGG